MLYLLFFILHSPKSKIEIELISELNEPKCKAYRHGIAQADMVKKTNEFESH